MVPLYVMVRLKVFQLVGFGSLAVPLSAWISEVSYSQPTQSCSFRGYEDSRIDSTSTVNA